MSATKILITEHGPYLVSGAVPLSEQALGLDREGNTWRYADTGAEVAQSEQYALCRCGHSANKPFCDGSHARMGFQDQCAARELPPPKPTI